MASTLAMPKVMATSAVGEGRWFYFGMATVFAVVAFAGFIPSYFMQVANHTFAAPPIFHIHAVLFFSWTLLNVAQTWFVATGRIYNHRNWGMLGIALGTAMVISVFLVIITAIKLAEAHVSGVPVKRFEFLSFSGAVKFVLFFGAAIAFVQRREIHKRLIVISNSTILGAPMGRLVTLTLVPHGLPGGPPPYAILLIVVLGYAPMLAGMIHDWRTRGRPHPVYIAGLVLGMGGGFLVPVIARTDTWLSVINSVVAVMG
jgi:hypothetical protein